MTAPKPQPPTGPDGRRPPPPMPPKPPPNGLVMHRPYHTQPSRQWGGRSR